MRTDFVGADIHLPAEDADRLFKEKKLDELQGRLMKGVAELVKNLNEEYSVGMFDRADPNWRPDDESV